MFLKNECKVCKQEWAPGKFFRGFPEHSPDSRLVSRSHFHISIETVSECPFLNCIFFKPHFALQHCICIWWLWSGAAAWAEFLGHVLHCDIVAFAQNAIIVDFHKTFSGITTAFQKNISELFNLYYVPSSIFAPESAQRSSSHVLFKVFHMFRWDEGWKNNFPRISEIISGAFQKYPDWENCRERIARLFYGTVISLS